MKVLIVSTNERKGGAAMAANRLMYALNNNGVKAKMLVMEKETDNVSVSELPSQMLGRWHFLWERWCVFSQLFFTKNHLFEIDIANSGTDITRLREFKDADIINLSWINQGMLSLKNIKKIIASGKPVVWTMHDLWPASSICHYARGCPSFKTGCHHCKLLPGEGSSNDLSSRLWKRKKALYANNNIYFVACSKWLESQAKQSGLLSGQRLLNIPNPIDTNIYHPTDKQAARARLGLPADKRIILFVSQRVTDTRKGISYLTDAIKKYVVSHPDETAKTCVAVLGGHAEEVVGDLPVEAFPIGYVSDEQKIVDVYNAADVFVLPSLEDNLPNTIMEAMACGVPCVAFRVGGIPEMIDHDKNGYVAKVKDADDLAEGIWRVLGGNDYEALSKAALRKVYTAWSPTIVAMKYIEIYNEAAAMKHLNL